MSEASATTGTAADPGLQQQASTIASADEDAVNASTSIDYLDLCRLCLQKDSVNLSIFEEEGEQRQMFLKISATLPVKIFKEDKLPKKICDDCSYKVELLYQFWNTAATSEKQLLQWLGEIGLDDKQNYEVLEEDLMKSEKGNDNRLNTNIIQVSDQNSIEISMIDNISLITIPAGSEQFTTVPIDASGTIQTEAMQSSHDQSQIEEDRSEMGDMSDDGCDNEGLPVKEESDDQNNQANMDQAYVSIEAGPSGIQHQKISELTIQQAADGDPKTGNNDYRRWHLKKFMAELNCTAVSDIPKRKPGRPPKLSIKNSKNHSLLLAEKRKRKAHSPIRKKKKIVDTPPKKKKKHSDPLPIRKRKRIVESDSNSETDIVPAPESPISYKSISESDSDSDAPIRKKKKKKDSEWKPYEKENSISSKKKKKPIEKIKIVLKKTPKAKKPPKEKKPTKEKKPPKEKRTFNVKKKTLSTKEPKKDGKKNKRGRKATTISDLNEKMLKCVKKLSFGLYLCTICGTEFTQRSSVPAHIKRKHFKNTKTCEVCNITCQNDFKYQLHMKQHEIQQFFCDKCDYVAKSKYYIKTHFIRKHTEDRDFECDLCGKKFKVKSDVKSHMASHNAAEYVCDICGKMFPSHNSVVRHRRVQHLNVYNFKCDICNEKLLTQQSLDRHVKKHERTFNCDECDWKFLKKHYLTRHKKRVHRVEKNNLCNVCGKSFVCSSTLRVHSLIHSKVKPYLCNVCGFSFTQRSSMMLHWRRKHPDAITPPPPVTLTTILEHLKNNEELNIELPNQSNNQTEANPTRQPATTDTNSNASTFTQASTNAPSTSSHVNAAAATPTSTHANTSSSTHSNTHVNTTATSTHSTHSNAHVNANPNTHFNVHAHAQPNTLANMLSNAHSNMHQSAHQGAHQGAHQNAHQNVHPNTHTNVNPNTHLHPHPHGNANSSAHSNAQHNPLLNTNHIPHPNAFPNTFPLNFPNAFPITFPNTFPHNFNDMNRI